jgi:membrane associated rhomboid family serine protease
VAVGVLSTDAWISWQGLLFGLLGGVVAAVLIRARGWRRPRDGDPHPSGSTPSLR